ncbi:serpin B [Antricoccus suffuscus]|uniref:Serpin B n=1 Tax=Antricoccus suffuscus TaxID=1629062 RepID=A0A2T0ZS38_9ACTN|nr:serpin family protein [Antricoccus suffuscus]PRZ39104.1 serpin B [Antricoccus suffuscus]
MQSVELSRRRALALGALATLSAALLGACSDEVPGRGSHGGSGGVFKPASGPAKPVGVSEAPEYVGAQLGFAFALLGQTSAATSQGNVIISPYSVAQVLSMIAQGAAGTTYEQIAAAMGIEGPADVLAKGSNATAGALEDLAKTTLSSGNALFRSAQFAVKKPFDQAMIDDFGTASYPTDFGNPTNAVGKINDWVAQSTNDKIKKLLKPNQVDANTRMVLVNAVYMLAKWKEQFDPDDTKPSTFQAASGDTKVAKMVEKLTFRYAELDGVEIVDLPYEDDNLLATFVVPPAGGLDAALKSGTSLASLVADERPEIEATLLLPKFEARLRVELTDVLGQLGITQAFTTTADFSALSDEPTHVSFVQHEAWVKVGEKGTEGAAATAGGQAATAVPGEKNPKIVDIDRPFIFLVREKTSNAVLFAATVRDPSLAAK